MTQVLRQCSVMKGVYVEMSGVRADLSGAGWGARRCKIAS
jgi:hypothetical protein